jgi:hypothetical protein
MGAPNLGGKNPAPGAAAPAAAPAAVPAAPAGTDILDANSYFRWRRVTGPLSFADASGPVPAPGDFARGKPPLSPAQI